MRPYIVFDGRVDVLHWLRTQGDKAEREMNETSSYRTNKIMDLAKRAEVFNEIADQLEASNLWKEPE